VHHYRQPVRWTEAPPVPVTYLATTLDRPVPIALQRTMAARLPGEPVVVDLETGHIPAITDPPLFAAALRAAASASVGP
jgi:pimeloyl-ACP methyl ester carboxylesterase